MTPESHAGTRTRLLDAARSLLNEVGIGGVTTRRVAERAGVNNALVHYYFGTKMALVVEAAMANLGNEVDVPPTLIREAPSLATGVAMVVNWIASVDLEHPGLRMVFELLFESIRNAEIQAIVAHALGSSRDDLQATLESRTDIDPNVAEPLAAMLAALFDGLMLHRIADPSLDVTSWQRAASHLMALFTQTEP